MDRALEQNYDLPIDLDSYDKPIKVLVINWRRWGRRRIMEMWANNKKLHEKTKQRNLIKIIEKTAAFTKAK